MLTTEPYKMQHTISPMHISSDIETGRMYDLRYAANGMSVEINKIKTDIAMTNCTILFMCISILLLQLRVYGGI